MRKTIADKNTKRGKQSKGSAKNIRANGASIQRSARTSVTDTATDTKRTPTTGEKRRASGGAARRGTGRRTVGKKKTRARSTGRKGA